MTARVQTVASFAKERGLTTDYDVMSHIHAGLRSMPTTKTYKRWNEETLARLQRERDETVRLYRIEVASGRIVEPRETLEDRASGHPDLASTQAARRVLAKRQARLAALQEGD